MEELESFATQRFSTEAFASPALRGASIGAQARLENTGVIPELPLLPEAQTLPKEGQSLWAFASWGGGARTLLGAPGHTTSNKKLLGAPGLTTRNKKATRVSVPRGFVDQLAAAGKPRNSFCSKLR